MPVGMKVTVETDTRGLSAVVGEAKTRNICLKGVRAGIKVLVGPAKAGAPKRSGALKQAQGYKAAKGRKGKTIAFGVQGARSSAQRTYKGKVVKPGKYDHLVQGGTKPHRLGKGEKLATQRIGKLADVFKPGTSQSSGERHPGAKPNPYRKRAFQAVKDQIGQAVNTAMGEEVQKIIARQGK
jgi:hypothetical protein